MFNKLITISCIRCKVLFRGHFKKLYCDSCKKEVKKKNQKKYREKNLDKRMLYDLVRPKRPVSRFRPDKDFCVILGYIQRHWGFRINWKIYSLNPDIFKYIHKNRLLGGVYRELKRP